MDVSVPEVGLLRARGSASNYSDLIANGRNRPRLRFAVSVDAGGKEGPHFWGEVRFPALLFGANRAEIDEPVLEDRPRHRFQCRVHPLVQIDFIVERAENSGDGLL